MVQGHLPIPDAKNRGERLLPKAPEEVDAHCHPSIGICSRANTSLLFSVKRVAFCYSCHGSHAACLQGDAFPPRVPSVLWTSPCPCNTHLRVRSLNASVPLHASKLIGWILTHPSITAVREEEALGKGRDETALMDGKEVPEQPLLACEGLP